MREQPPVVKPRRRQMDRRDRSRLQRTAVRQGGGTFGAGPVSDRAQVGLEVVIVEYEAIFVHVEKLEVKVVREALQLLRRLHDRRQRREPPPLVGKVVQKLHLLHSFDKSHSFGPRSSCLRALAHRLIKSNIAVHRTS